MQTERRKQVQDVFSAALACEPAQRSAVVAELCSEDAALRSEVESLLKLHDTGQHLAAALEFPATGVGTGLSTPAAEELVGLVIDQYEICALLAAGGMAEVYRAKDRRLGREVALKILPHPRAGEESLLRRFEQEIRAVAALSHPNICHLYDAGRWRGRPYFTMELLEGQTLRDYIQGRPLPAAEVLTFGVQIANALDAAHTKGIIHRDIKPPNIVITQEGSVKVLDFGLAKRAELLGEETASAGRTAPGTTMGTVAYMSPEQARAEELDARTDLFSFGVLLYEMATGEQPFRGSSNAVVFNAILNQTPVAPSRLNREMGEEFDRLVMTALEKDREVRFQSAAEIRASLRRLQRARETPALAMPAESSGEHRSSSLPGSSSHDAGATRSLAVLPFQMLNAEAEGAEYLGLGLADALVTKLNEMKRLVVRPTSSAYKYAH